MEYVKKRDGLSSANLDGKLSGVKSLVSRLFRPPSHRSGAVSNGRVSPVSRSVSFAAALARTSYDRHELQRLLR